MKSSHLPYKLFLLILILGATGRALAFDASKVAWCKASAWPISRDLSVRQLDVELSSIPRMSVLQYGWGEILSANPKHMVAPIFRYLAGTEQKQKLRSYYEIMSFAAMDSVSAEDAVNIWPKRVPLAKEQLKLPDLCQYYEESRLASRAPSSVKGSRKKTRGLKVLPASPHRRGSANKPTQSH